jgi:hypothetical protein
MTRFVSLVIGTGKVFFKKRGIADDGIITPISPIKPIHPIKLLH